MQVEVWCKVFVVVVPGKLLGELFSQHYACLKRPTAGHVPHLDAKGRIVCP